MIRLIVGLANPGKEYQKTRHNVGGWFIESICQARQLTLHEKSSFHGQYTYFQDRGSTIHLCVPTTFMNHSGRAVAAIANYYKIFPEQILIVHDELDFNAGVIKFKEGGGTGGHNGLKDIIHVIKSNSFWRLRLGIGHPGDKHLVHRYVLSPPSALEHRHIQCAIDLGLSVLDQFFMGDTKKAMQKLHSGFKS